MGGSQGKQAPTPAPAPAKTLTDVPWRQPSARTNELQKSLIEEINRLKGDKMPNLLMLGPVGAGKSSFVTAVLTIGEPTRYGQAHTGQSSSSYTLKLKRHTVNTVLENFNLYDCMGIEPDEGHGFPIQDIVFLLQGHMGNNYEFDPKVPMTKKNTSYRPNPGVDDRIHCVVFVLNATTLHAVSPANIQKIKELQDKIRREDIPRVLVLTKCDILCSEVKERKANLFSSVKVQEAMKLASEMFSIEMASIHPVINYEETGDSCPEINIPLLLAVRQMASYAVGQLRMISD